MEAGEVRGTAEALLAAKQAAASIVEASLKELAISVGTEIAGELGAKLALQTAIPIGIAEAETRAGTHCPFCIDLQERCKYDFLFRRYGLQCWS